MGKNGEEILGGKMDRKFSGDKWGGNFWGKNGEEILVGKMGRKFSGEKWEL